ncbi:MAG: hypothetical protein NVS2B7_28310 [Herpetosiphon sp.]
MRLGQVFRNLLHNALKYSPRNGVVDVDVEVQSQMVQVSVRDYGLGIPPAALPDLFTPFFRADNVVKEHIGGMGIGLYVVREIVELHGGEVRVSSVEGEGTVFRVFLPLVSDDAVMPS